MGKTVFNLKWIAKYGWVRECKDDRYKAKCFACRKIIDLGKMGENALKSHMKNAKHKSNNEMLEDLSSMHLFTTASSSTDIKLKNGPKASKGKTLCDMAVPVVSVDVLNIEPLQQLSTGAEVQPSKKSMLHFAVRNVFEAEILWTFKTVADHVSYRSNENVAQLFRKMFLDSAIAQKFSCGERKTAYLCVFGIAPYLKDLMLTKVKGQGPFVVSFDETLNKKNQKKQMDIHIHFWVGRREQSHHTLFWITISR